MQAEIRKLRIRFVATVVVIVTVVLASVFGCLLGFVNYSLLKTSEAFLIEISKNDSPSIEFLRPVNKNTEDVQLPYFVVDISEVRLGSEAGKKYAIIRNFGGYFDITDTDVIETVVNEAMAQDNEMGYLSEYSLRYYKQVMYDGTYTLAFVDVSSSNNMFRDVLNITFHICLVGIAIFVVIAILLSKWIVRPIERSWNQQKQFISDASHELKTPLTVITTNAEMLQAPNVEEESRKKYTDNIMVVSQQMRTLVEDMLNLSRLEKAEFSSYERLNLSDCLNDTLMQFEPLMFELGLPLEENIQSDVFVKGSSTRLGQLLTILLDNAGKYSLPGEVSVQLTTQGKNAVLSVSNPASPMSEEDLKRIFTRFYRMDESHNEKGSYGLGLSIAQKICESHKGKIKAEYKDGMITFVVVLPLI